MYVRKRSGELEPFDRRKALRAITRTGASEEEAKVILDRLLPGFYDGMSTSEIYRRIYGQLDDMKRVVFSTKQAVFGLGPEGHLFEDYIGRVLNSLGYRVKLRQMIDGECLRHEVDVIAEKDGRLQMVECKFHNNQGTVCNSQTAMYTYARFLDLNGKHGLERPWLVTNTSLSSDALRYACCVGMNVMSWGEPEGKGLKDIIHERCLYPVTVLNISPNTRDRLFSQGIVMASDVLSNEDGVYHALSKSTANRVIQRAKDLPDYCRPAGR